MFQEELPAIISTAFIVVVFFAAFWHDMRRVRKIRVDPERLASKPRGEGSISERTHPGKRNVTCIRDHAQ